MGSWELIVGLDAWATRLEGEKRAAALDCSALGCMAGSPVAAPATDGDRRRARMRCGYKGRAVELGEAEEGGGGGVTGEAELLWTTGGCGGMELNGRSADARGPLTQPAGPAQLSQLNQAPSTSVLRKSFCFARSSTASAVPNLPIRLSRRLFRLGYHPRHIGGGQRWKAMYPLLLTALPLLIASLHLRRSHRSALACARLRCPTASVLSGAASPLHGVCRTSTRRRLLLHLPPSPRPPPRLLPVSVAAAVVVVSCVASDC